MNIKDNISDLWFSVIRIGTARVLVNEGCIFNFTGRGGLLITAAYTSQAENKLIPIANNQGDEYPGDDLGTHIYIDEQEFDVEEGSKIWLHYSRSTEIVTSKVSITTDSFQTRLHTDHLTHYAVLRAKNFYINREGIEYLCSKTDYSHLSSELEHYVLLATISFSEVPGSEEKLMSITQVHDGAWFAYRYQEILGPNDEPS